MKLEKIVAFAGQPGLYKIVAARTNGIVASNLDGSGTKFIPARGHEMSLLEAIAIYTDTDTIPLKDVFLKMLDAIETTPPVSAKSDEKELRAYLAAVLPNYDRSRVHVSDIKKLIKWFGLLNGQGLIFHPAPEEAAATTEETAETSAE
jgi:hypothetical protein